MERLRRLRMSTALAVVMSLGCNGTRAPEALPPKTPTLRLFLLSNIAGALEPCGCQKDMLGGVDHAAAILAARSNESATLTLGAGPMLFEDPTLQDVRSVQDDWKAEAIAQGFHAMDLSAWAPGANDWAKGTPRLAALARTASAEIVAANLTGESGGAKPFVVIERAGHKIGVLGVSVPRAAGSMPKGVETLAAKDALAAAVRELDARGARVKIGLLAMDRGEALRLIEQVSGLGLVLLGKPFERGHGNDAPSMPVLVGETLVVQAPNHLQGVAIVDLFVRGDDVRFRDATGLEALERKASLEARIAELERRIARWEGDPAAPRADVEARKKDLALAKDELGKQRPGEPPKTGSFFRYELVDVRESAGVDDVVQKSMTAFYARVNEHNRTAFANRKPPPLAKGQPGFVGVAECATCHEEEEKFWLSTAHARAYATLEKGHKEFNLECVGCHVTGYEQPGGSTVTHVALTKNVQCETCHGPGSKHAASSDPAHIRKTPAKGACTGECHHPPHVGPDFSVDAEWEKIIGKGHGR